MKTFLTLLVLAVSVINYAQDTLTILHLNDTHSMLAPLAPRDVNLQGTRGGIARAASFIGMNKLSEPNVLTLHAGDFFVGDIFFNTTFGVAELSILKDLGIDAMTVGNHEFDLTPATLETALTTAFPTNGIPLLSANLNLSNDTVAGLRQFIKPYFIKQFGSIKVGILGLTTPETNLFSLPYPAIIEEDFVTIAAQYIDTLVSQNCNVIILLSHLGVYYDWVLAQMLTGINVIVGGHDHYNFEEPIAVTNPAGKPTWIVQTEGTYHSIGKIKLAVQNQSVNLLSYENTPLDLSIPQEPTVKTIIDTLIAQIENTYGAVYTQQIGVATDYFDEVADSLYKSGNHETAVGNFVADAYRWKTGADISIQVGGSTCQPIHQGPIVPADLFRVVGYGFNEVNGLGYRLCKIKMTGEALMMGLEIGLSQIQINDELLPQVSGMSYSYDIGDTVMRLRNPLVNGIPLNPLQVYSVATNEFLIAAMDLFGITYSDVYVYNDSSEFQVLVDYAISLNGVLTPKYENRVTWLQRNEFAIPSVFELKQNYPNPFNPETTIEFYLPKNSFVELSIYSVTGEKIVSLLNEELYAGSYRLKFDARELSSGVYFCKMKTEHYSSIIKMLLLK